MNRRAYIGLATSGLVGSLAGCTGTLGTGSDASRTISVSPVDHSPSAFAFDVEVAVDTIHGDEPATLEVVCQYSGSDTLEIQTETAWLFGPVSSEDTELILSSFDTDSDTLGRSSDGCWRVEGRLGQLDAPGRTVLETGDAVSEELQVYGYEEELGDRCPEPGTYLFEWGYAYRPVPQADEVPEDLDGFTWGIELTIE